MSSCQFCTQIIKCNHDSFLMTMIQTMFGQGHLAYALILCFNKKFACNIFITYLLDKLTSHPVIWYRCKCVYIVTLFLTYFISLSQAFQSNRLFQFTLEHAFADSDFSHASNFSFGVKTWSHDVAQTLTKLHLTRDSFTNDENNKFQELLRRYDFYRIRLPSNVLSPLGRGYISSMKVRCLPGRNSLEEHFVIHTEDVVGYQLRCPQGLPLSWATQASCKVAFQVIHTLNQQYRGEQIVNTLFREIVNE